MPESSKFPDFNNTDFNLDEVYTYHVGRLESASHRAMRAFKDDYLKQYGLTAMQWYIIGTIHDSGEKGMRITDISKKLGTTLGFMTNSVNLLASKDILIRLDNESDNRSKHVVLNSSFKKTCIEIELGLREKLKRHIYKQISPDDLKSYIKTLKSLSEINSSN